MSKLAALGGTAIRASQSWPRWPAANVRVLDDLRSVLDSQRWTVRAHWHGGRAREREFAEAFARSSGAKHAVTVPNGTSALSLALEALGIGAGDEVILPALTWVASAVSILNTNAIPVFVDVDPQMLVMTADAVRAGLSPRTAAIMPVHLHCAIAPMGELVALAQNKGLAVVEDCAQANGGVFEGKGVGTWGDAGAFSFHNDKLVSCGEGGAVITDHGDSYAVLQSLRLDGFAWSDEPRLTIEGWYEQEGYGPVMGGSNCMSEFQAVVAQAQLEELDVRTRRREENGRILDALLGTIPGLTPVPRVPGTDVRPYYEYCLHYEADAFDGAPVEAVSWAVTAEIGFPIYPESDPVHRNPLYKPYQRKRFSQMTDHLKALADGSFRLPVSESAPKRVIRFLHPPLLGSASDMADIAAAFEKVHSRAAELRQLSNIPGVC
jgi:dTDP-4-amino-4,6-dideoxygalactose transaminase